MIKWIIIAIVACIAIAIVKVIFEWIKERFFYIAAIGIPIVMIRLICPEIKLIFIIIGVVVAELILFGIYKGILFIKEKLARRKEIKLVNKWLAQRPKMLLSNWVLDKLYDYAKTLYIDMSKNYHSTFMRYDENTEIPIGRYYAFLSYFNRDPLVETPLAMFIKNSSSFNEIREYGCVFTEKRNLFP